MKSLSTLLLSLMFAALSGGCLISSGGGDPDSVEVCGNFTQKAWKYLVYLSISCVDADGNLAVQGNSTRDNPVQSMVSNRIIDISGEDAAGGFHCFDISRAELSTYVDDGCTSRGFISRPAVHVVTLWSEADEQDPDVKDQCATAVYRPGPGTLDFVSDPARDSVRISNKPETYCPAWTVAE